MLEDIPERPPCPYQTERKRKRDRRNGIFLASLAFGMMFSMMTNCQRPNGTVSGTNVRTYSRH
jgi:hypothetical protein